jgi:hypothetical protein
MEGNQLYPHDTDWNVAIGRKTPNAKLDVAGGVKIAFDTSVCNRDKPEPCVIILILRASSIAMEWNGDLFLPAGALAAHLIRANQRQELATASLLLTAGIVKSQIFWLILLLALARLVLEPCNFP